MSGPTGEQVERARAVSRWRRQMGRRGEVGLRWHEQDAYAEAAALGLRWSTEDTLSRAYVLRVQRIGAHMPNTRGTGQRTITVLR